jgi:hypothetical protein
MKQTKLWDRVQHDNISVFSLVSSVSFVFFDIFVSLLVLEGWYGIYMCTVCKGGVGGSEEAFWVNETDETLGLCPA